MLASGLAAGWVAKRHVMFKQRSAFSSKKNLGDAPQSVRSEVLKQLKSFQAGYTKRDPGQVNQFMNELFPRRQKYRTLGHRSQRMDHRV